MSKFTREEISTAVFNLRDYYTEGYVCPANTDVHEDEGQVFASVYNDVEGECDNYVLVREDGEVFFMDEATAAILSWEDDNA